MSQPDSLPPLTDRQAAILREIASHVKRRGYPPTVREIGDAVGLVSPSSVAYQLGEIARKGYIRRDVSVSRGLALVVEPQTREVFDAAQS